MLTGQLRSQIDGIWNDFWSGGLANPLQVIEQITYLIPRRVGLCKIDQASLLRPCYPVFGTVDKMLRNVL